MPTIKLRILAAAAATALSAGATHANSLTDTIAFKKSTPRSPRAIRRSFSNCTASSPARSSSAGSVPTVSK